MNLLGFIKGILVRDETDKTKRVSLEIDPSSTTNTQTTVKAAQTTDQTITLPDATDTLVGKATTDIFTNKSVDADNNTITNLETDNLKSGVLVTDVSTATSDTELPSALAVKTALEAQNEADEITYDNATSGLTATDVQAAIDEVEGRLDTAETGLSDHLSDAVDAHDASAISFDNASSGLTATDAQAAIDEVEGRVDTLEGAAGGANTTLSNLTSPTAINQDLNGDTGSAFTVKSKDDATADANPTENVQLKSGDKGAGTGDSGNVILESGSSTGGSRGTINLKDGSEGTAGHVWTSTGVNGEGNWAAGAGGGDAWSDPVDSNIVPTGNDDTYNLGSSTDKFADVFSNEADLGTSTGGKFNNIWGTEIPGVILDGTTTDALNAGAAGMALLAHGGQAEMLLITSDQAGTTSSSRVNIYTGQSSGTSGSSGSIDLFTGDNSATTGNSGSITLRSGDSTNSDSGQIRLATGTAGGNRGVIKLEDGSEGTSGHVWTSVDVNGTGQWQAVPGQGGVRSETSGFTASINDDILLVSGASFTVNLPTAVGNTRKEYVIKKTDSNLANVITIDPDTTETIGGTTTRTLRTHNEAYRIVSDGANWIILDHQTETELVNDGVVSIGAVTTNPSKGTTSIDRVFWKREGQYLYAQYEFDQNTAGTAGSGDYLVSLPAGLAMDTAFITLNTAAAIESQTLTIGEFAGNSGAAFDHNNGHAVPYSSSQFRITGRIGGSTSPWGSGLGGLNNTTVCIGGWIKVPIANWDA